MIKGIIFDAEDVIYYRDDETLKPILEFFKEKGFDISSESLKHALDENKLDTFKGRISKDDHLRKTLEILQIKFDDNFFNDFAKIFREEYSNIKIKEKIHEIFETLKNQRIKIAILTDTSASEQKKQEWLESINVAQFIDVLVCSSVTGHTKDEKESYETVLQKLNLKAEEAVFVGHKEYEMQGAKLAGVKSISIEKGIGEDHYVQDISEIPNLIQKI